ncbi:voltage-gated chloride channel family protein [Deefgea rivuli]|uniref:voltage-gated chloride channel family protein n=1 Tax=Deefgea rivuli TaxID=400948 RepID=UPI0004867DDE|nr:voltage-gated chloride channel family protein [Deefgea rivuli]
MLERHFYRQTFLDLAVWLPLACVIGLLGGGASAVLLLALDWATMTRVANPALIWFLPVAGFAVGWLYHQFGRGVESGSNLLIDEIHNPKAVIPLKMAPLVLIGTVLSHLFGASVGREGTAVQMSGTFADQIALLTKRGPEGRRVILMAGMSAGFAGVFGTPLAGAVFGLEVLALGKMRNNALFPCLIASLVSDCLVRFLGVQHTHYFISVIPEITLKGIVAVLFAGIIFGLSGKFFAEITHWIAHQFKRISYPPFRPLLGGLVIAIVVYWMGAYRYIGLGIPSIVESFQQPLSFWDAPLKMLLTTFSLGAGFKGGEVTPLFYIGATLGNALAPILDMPYPLLAGLGFVAVFAGAANTPLACTFMAIELFGAAIAPYALLACVVAYLFSGHSSIYVAQRLGSGKGRPLANEKATIRISDMK